MQAVMLTLHAKLAYYNKRTVGMDRLMLCLRAKDGFFLKLAAGVL